MNTYNVPIAKRTRLQKQQGKKINREAGFTHSDECQEVIDVAIDDSDDGGGNRASELDNQFESDDKIGCYGSPTNFNSVAKRTRLQTQLRYQLSLKRKRDAGVTQFGVNQEDYVVIDVDDDEDDADGDDDFDDDEDDADGDDDWINNTASKTNTQYGYGSASPFKTDKHEYYVYSDEDDTVVSLEEEDADEALQTSWKLQHESENNMQAWSFQSTEDESFSSSESEEVNLNKILNPADESIVHEETVDPKLKENDMEDSFSSLDRSDSDDESVVRKEKNLSVHKTNMKKTDKKPLDESSITNVCEKQNAINKVKDQYMKVDKTNPVKYNKCKKQGEQRDYGGRMDDILNSIISNEDVYDKKEGDCLPLTFRFDESEDESSQRTDESSVEDLFQEMEFAFKCDEIGSYKIPNVENVETGDYYDDIDPCESGTHGDVYLEEETGLRCCLCGAVLLESRYVIQKLATYAADRPKRRSHFDEQHEFSSLENPYFIDSESNPYDICHETKGTVWELVPARHREHMYPHQHEGFEFLWKNLAGTTELSRLQTPGPHGGGCIISHAPGTGKTFLTIVFMESFLKKFPKCRPVIVAPACMLLTWAAEFNKWQVGFSFINLQNTEPLREEKIIGNSRNNKDYIRALKIKSWINGGGVLGVSYNLFEKLTRISYEKNTDCENSRMCLLDMPGLIVLDEGHTPRNQNSKIWNSLLKLKTKMRVILSGTPFQNNFRELFNTLRIVRPATAKSIENKKLFSDMIQRTNVKKSRGRSTSEEDIETLKKTISPFVHVHEGHILESKLPGLKQSVIFLNPPAFQNSFIKNLELSGGTFGYDHKTALVSVHPSLILQCSLLSEKEKNMINKKELEKKRLQPEAGVKTRFVMELIRLSLSLNEKVLIFTQYIEPSELLKEQIALTFGWDVEQEVTLIKGRISQSRRQYIINAFNDPKSELKVLLASTKCCSEGIHLFGASRVVLLDVVWNPSVESQAIHRAYRLGQKKVVYTYQLMAAGTTEEEKYDKKVEKWRLAEMVFSSASMAGGEPKNKMNVDDKILQEMVENQELKGIFKKIMHPENQTRI